MKQRGTLRQLASGRTPPGIALDTYYSYETIKSRVANLYRALGAVNAANAVALGHAYGYLAPKGVLLLPVLPADDMRLIYLTGCAYQSADICIELGCTVPTIQYRKKVIRQTWRVPNFTAAVDRAYRAQLIAKVPRKDYRK